MLNKINKQEPFTVYLTKHRPRPAYNLQTNDEAQSANRQRVSSTGILQRKLKPSPFLLLYLKSKTALRNTAFTFPSARPHSPTLTSQHSTVVEQVQYTLYNLQPCCKMLSLTVRCNFLL